MKNLAIITLLFILSAQAEHHHHCHEKEFEKRGFSFTTLALQYAHKHKEYRADLTAASGNIQIAQNFVKNFEYSIEEFPALQEDLSYWVTHPSSKDRLIAMNQLISYLDAEQRVV